MAPVLEGHPDLDQVVTARLRPWRQSPLARATRREVRSFVAALRGFTPDVVLDLMGNHKAGIIASLSGARRRIGPARPFRREPSSALWINEPISPRGTHAVDRALSLLDALEIPTEAADFGGRKLFPRVPAAAARLLAEHRQEHLFLHPGAGWANKIYPPTWWGEALHRIRDATGLATWVATAPWEEEAARKVVAASRGAGRTVPAADLPTLAALLRSSRLVLGGDSGPLHLAHALGLPVLCLMGPTDPRRHGPYSAPERALAVALPCSFCYKRLPETKACLLAIPPSEVAQRAVELLA